MELSGTFRLPDPITFEGNVCEKWKRFRQKFELYLVANSQGKKIKDEVKIAQLLNLIGDEGLDVFNTFSFDEHEKESFDCLLEKFESYCNPKKNVVFERFKFYNIIQEEGQEFGQFVKNLKLAAQSCEFYESENMIRDRIVLGINDKSTQERLLRNTNLDLKKAIEFCTIIENSRKQCKLIEEQSERTKAGQSNVKVDPYSINVVSGKSKWDFPSVPDKEGQSYSCKFCGYNHVRGKCPAYGKTCSKCKNKNHFAIVCKSKTKATHVITNKELESNDSNGSDLSLGTVMLSIGGVNELSDKSWKENLIVGGVRIEFKLDTGAEISILPLSLVKKINVTHIKRSNFMLSAWGDKNFKIKPLGHVVLQCKTMTGDTADVDFAVVNVEHELPILGLNDCVNLGLIRRVSSIKSQLGNKDDILRKYKTVFDGLGSFPGFHHIELQKGAIPHVQQSRRVPYSLKNKLKEKLDQLEKSEVIRKVDKPTAWVNPLVIVEKPDKTLRICIDPMHLNRVVMREHFLMPHPDDMLVTLSGYKFFTVLDLKDGFFHIVLDEESRELCTVSTPFGRYQFCRFPFGVCSGPEICQKNNYKCFGDLKGVNIVHDDIIVGGITENEHDENLQRVLNTALKYGIKFNSAKMQFKRSEVKYLGHIVSVEGVKPDPEYVRAIVDMASPTDKKAVMRLLGMLKYLSKFIPNLAKISAPLRYLTRKDVNFLWEEEHETALKVIKTIISSDQVLTYFDSKAPIEIQTDASHDGLGSCLLQNGRPVAFMSRSLTDTEKRYSQLEKEMLAIVFAVEKFHRFIYGYKVVLWTDHKPLVNIFQQDLHKVPGRLQKMRMKCLSYYLEVRYMPGSNQFIADTLSRVAMTCTEPPKSTDFQIHSLTNSLPMTEEKRKLFIKYIEEDEDTSLVKKYCLEGWPERKQDTPETVRHYWNIRNMISEENGLLFMIHKLIVPKQLKQDMLQRIHTSHGGIEKCKARARQILYWPRMAADIEHFVARCRTCERFSRNNTKETLMPYPIPTRPWERIGCDIFSFGGKSFLVMMDAYSNWLEIVRIQDKSASSIIVACKEVFSRFGSPDILVADNVPCNSVQMRDFAREWNFEVITRSPGYAQSNGLAEKAVGMAKELIKKTENEGKDFMLALLELRNMPVKHIGYSPAQLMFQRRCKTTIPVAGDLLKPVMNEDVQNRLILRQQLQKRNYDKSAKDLRIIKDGERVIYRNDGRWEHGKIVQPAPTPRSYWVEGDNGMKLRRNRRHLKPSVDNVPTDIRSTSNLPDPKQHRPQREIRKPARFMT